jgi:hypothetical protein
VETVSFEVTGGTLVEDILGAVVVDGRSLKRVISDIVLVGAASVGEIEVIAVNFALIWVDGFRVGGSVVSDKVDSVVSALNN